VKWGRDVTIRRLSQALDTIKALVARLHVQLPCEG
jgi:hypothetical protein